MKFTIKAILPISILTMSLAGCAYSIKEVDVSKAQPSCVK